MKEEWERSTDSRSRDLVTYGTIKDIQMELELKRKERKKKGREGGIEGERKGEGKEGRQERAMLNRYRAL